MLAVSLGAVAVAGIDRLADATQTRPDHQPPGTYTEIVYSIEVHSYRQAPLLAAQAVWGTCAATVSSRLTAPIEDLGDGRYRIVVTPALGEHGRERVTGCLNDLTLDRVRSSLVRMARVDRPATTAEG